MRVLVTGSRGLVGAALVHAFGDHDVVALDRHALDITDAAAVERAVTTARPDVIVNGAVNNGVDRAEDEPVPALRVNALAVRTLARAARAHDAVLVHFSTDFVFDGETNRPYVEEDVANPQSVYGASKLLGDWFALEAPRAYVLRVESVFGATAPTATRRGSLATLVDRIVEGAEVPVFVDRVVSPTHTADIARATRTLLESKAPYGLYHCVNSGAATWEQIAQFLAEQLGKPLRTKPMTLATAGLKARRPRFCALNNSKLAAVGVPMPPWQEAVEAYLDRTKPAGRR
jgi:dTDP-4-dehydrorhamnose reductase